MRKSDYETIWGNVGTVLIKHKFKQMKNDDKFADRRVNELKEDDLNTITYLGLDGNPRPIREYV